MCRKGCGISIAKRGNPAVFDVRLFWGRPTYEKDGPKGRVYRRYGIWDYRKSRRAHVSRHARGVVCGPDELGGGCLHAHLGMGDILPETVGLRRLVAWKAFGNAHQAVRVMAGHRRA